MGTRKKNAPRRSYQTTARNKDTSLVWKFVLVRVSRIKNKMSIVTSFDILRIRKFGDFKNKERGDLN